MRSYFVYILSNRSRTLYTGVTNDIVRRVMEHRAREVPGFTAKYKLKDLVYFEETSSVEEAITREKQIKGWLRSKKVALIEELNPQWEDLSEGWIPKEDSSLRSE